MRDGPGQEEVPASLTRWMGPLRPMMSVRSALCCRRPRRMPTPRTLGPPSGRVQRIRHGWRRSGRGDTTPASCLEMAPDASRAGARGDDEEEQGPAGGRLARRCLGPSREAACDESLPCTPGTSGRPTSAPRRARCRCSGTGPAPAANSRGRAHRPAPWRGAATKGQQSLILTRCAVAHRGVGHKAVAVVRPRRERARCAIVRPDARPVCGLPTAPLMHSTPWACAVESRSRSGARHSSARAARSATYWPLCRTRSPRSRLALDSRPPSTRDRA